MGRLEDWYLDRAEARVPRSDDEEILLLRTKLEVRTMFMRMWRSIATSLFTGLVTGAVLRLIFK